MTVPVNEFVTITTAEVAANEPAKTEIMDKIRKQLLRAYEILLAAGVSGDDAVIQIAHAHKGRLVDGSEVVSIGNSAIPWLADPITLVSGGNATAFADVDASASIVPEEADMDVQWLDAPSTLVDKTSVARLNDGANTGVVMDNSADFLYIGANEAFTKILVDLATAAAGAGALTVEFFDVTAFTPVSGLSDGTDTPAAPVDTFEQNGGITWTLPVGWKTGAQVVQTGLSSSLFYVRLSFANSATGPNIDQAAPKPFTAKLVFLQCRIDGSSSIRLDLRLRRNGSSDDESVVPHLHLDQTANVTPTQRGMLIVGLDASEIFEYKTINSLNAVFIVLVGFVR